MPSAETESSALVVALSALSAALAPLEAKGLRIVGLHTTRGAAAPCVALAVRGVGAVAACRLVGASLGGGCVRAPSTVDEALELLLDAFGAHELLADTDLDELAGCMRLQRAPAQTGLVLDLEALLAAEPGSEPSRLFCRALRVEGYVHVRCPPPTVAVLRRLEQLCSEWYSLPTDDKEADISEYGHVDRKFTGYRQGRYREQLEVRLEAKGGVLPAPARVAGLAHAFEAALSLLEAHGRRLLAHVAHDIGVDVGWLLALLDPDGSGAPNPPDELGEAATDDARNDPSLRHSLVRACRYVAGVRGVGGSSVLCDEHTDVGFLTLDAHACRPGLEVRRRADRLWVPVEEEGEASCERMAVMVGDTLERVTARFYAATPHRVHAPHVGERIGLPFLLRGRSDALIDVRAPRSAAAAAGRSVHLAQMESTTIKELPAMDAAQSILHSWFRSSKAAQ